MIREFVDVFMNNKEQLAGQIGEQLLTYTDLVELLVKLLHGASYEEIWAPPDPERITVISDGDFQGSMLFVIGESGYQPSRYWSIFIDYGSCSHCDTVQHIWEQEDPKVRQKDYIMLMLHMVQNMKQL